MIGKKHIYTILLLLIPQILAAETISIENTTFHCNKLNWNNISLQAQLHSKTVGDCLLGHIYNQTLFFKEQPFKSHLYLAKVYGHQTDYRNCTYYAQKALNFVRQPSDSINALLLLEFAVF